MFVMVEAKFLNGILPGSKDFFCKPTDVSTIDSKQ